MAFKIKHDIGTAVSVTLVVSRNEETGVEVTQEEIFLPGAEVPENVSADLIAKYNAGDKHVCSLFTVDDGGVPSGYLPSEDASGAQAVATGAGTPVVSPQTGNAYVDWKRPDLEAEVDKRTAAGRTITITGTGSGGAVKNVDIANALAADDQVADAPPLNPPTTPQPGQENPFAGNA
jgi:hypothetical protein